MDEQKEIGIDSNTQQNLQNLITARQNIEAQIRLILQTILNINGLEGNWTLSNDFTTLIKQEEAQNGMDDG